MLYLMFSSRRQEMTRDNAPFMRSRLLGLSGVDAVILAWVSATTRDLDEMHAKN